MKDLGIQEENNKEEDIRMSIAISMPNMTTSAASGEGAASGVSSSSTHIHPPHEQQHYLGQEITTTDNQPPTRRKRNLPGNPDPTAEVIALSPRSLLATNKFWCEICNKGFQRDQNLQLHRRGHNLPWKLKQRTSKESQKKVYICPEPTCVHHDRSRALGDLTGIKKHFCRKHGEKKWKCEKCSKKYAVLSDWKAHSKTCGMREYRCDCGNVFSRRDSFSTHRAFCDALAEERARATTTITTTIAGSNLPFLSSPPVTLATLPHHQLQQHQSFNPLDPRLEIPPWLSCPPPPVDPLTSSIFVPLDQNQINVLDPNPNPNPSLAILCQPITSSHMSATALLQKAAQMGAKSSGNSRSSFSLNLSPFVGEDSVHACKGPAIVGHHSHMLVQDMINSLSSSSTSASECLFAKSAFEDHQNTDTFCGVMMSPSKKEGVLINGEEGEMTRDFLGLRPISSSDFLNFGEHVNSHGGHYHMPKNEGNFS